MQNKRACLFRTEWCLWLVVKSIEQGKKLMINEVGGARMRKLIILISICTLCMVGSTAQAVNLLTNGDFETGDLTGWWTYVPASTTITVVSGGGYLGTNGAHLTNLGGTEDVKLGQDIAWTAGVSIDGKISLMYDTISWGGGGVTVRWLDSSWGYLDYAWAPTFSGNGADSGWLSFTASSSVSGSSGNWIAPAGTAYAEVVISQWSWSDASFDNVVLTPEPATMVLLGIGGLVALRRKHA
jgi:hypothetical protein